MYEYLNDFQLINVIMLPLLVQIGDVIHQQHLNYIFSIISLTNGCIVSTLSRDLLFLILITLSIKCSRIMNNSYLQFLY